MTAFSRRRGNESCAILTARLADLLHLTDEELIPDRIVTLAEELQIRLSARARLNGDGS